MLKIFRSDTTCYLVREAHGFPRLSVILCQLSMVFDVSVCVSCVRAPLHPEEIDRRRRESGGVLLTKEKLGVKSDLFDVEH